MWQVYIVLPALAWALGPVPNAIDVVTPGQCFSGDVCKPISQCSLWYSEFRALPQEPCTDFRGAVGMCCPDVVNVHSIAIKLPEVGYSRTGPVLPPIPPAIIEKAVRAARADLVHMNVVEEDLTRAPFLVMNRNSMAWAHSINMAPQIAAKLQGDRALLTVNAARRLQDMLRLTPEQASIGLQVLDARASLLEDTCLAPPQCLLIAKYRTFDGSCNNLGSPNWGRALTTMERLAAPQYADGIWEPKIGAPGRELPNVRIVRNILVTDEYHPVYDMTHMLMQWGQFIDHDMAHVPVFRTANQSNINCCMPNGEMSPPEMRHPHCFPIEIPPGDNFYGPRGVRCLNFVRSMLAPRSDCRLGYSNQMNQLTHFIDGSHIYGPNSEKAAKLREFAGGRLAVSVIDGRPYLPQDPTAKGCVGRKDGLHCFISGDSRTNQIMGLTSLHILFLRQHNNFAAALAALNPQWNDEVIYQESRRIIIALLQHITYNEFLPALLGRRTMDAYGLTPQTVGFSESYDDTVNPSITNEFSAAAFRMGHSLIQGALQLVEEDGSVRMEQMRYWFDNPHILREPRQMDSVLRGLITDWPQQVDEWVTEEVTNHLFQSSRRDFGFDLISLNLWRGRDHGLPGYNTYRGICGLPRVAHFKELLTTMDPSVVNRLAAVYRSVDDIDLYIGGLVERHLPGSMLGPVFNCIIADQFARLKEGDRFFYEHGEQPGSFTPAQLQEIRRMSLAAIICDNADQILQVQPLVVRSPSLKNPRVRCDSPRIPRMSLAPWKV